MGLYDMVAGVGDHMAGSIDESVGRQFDNEQGGGIFDTDTYTGWADHAAGSVDESIGRQFDDTEGGGFADEIANGSFDFLSGQADWWAGDVDEQVGEATGMLKYALIAVTGLAMLVTLSGGKSDE